MFIASTDLDKTEKENSSNASFVFFNFWHLGTNKCDSHNSQILELVGEIFLSKDPTPYHPLNILSCVIILFTSYAVIRKVKHISATLNTKLRALSDLLNCGSLAGCLYFLGFL